MGQLGPIESQRMAASAVGVLLSKSFQLSGDVHLAMQSRGFRGEVYVRWIRALCERRREKVRVIRRAMPAPWWGAAAWSLQSRAEPRLLPL